MTIKRISSGSQFEAEIGYSRAVVVQGHVYVAGTTGFDYESMTIADEIVEQCEQCLRNIEAALEQAGSRLDLVYRVRYILPRREDWPPCWPLVSQAFVTARPAGTMIVAELQDPRMKIEIEVDATLP
ncbi:RidA family protein [Gammaproteobacteria bacterium]|nr:RidA family protein [Gammaproteobacteria bacterium]